jgi:hypothetical protein
MLLDDLDEFRQTHQPHGDLAATVGGITPNGYGLTVACRCGIVFERWITDVQAHRENILMAWRVREN